MTQTATRPIDRLLPLLKGYKEIRSGKPGYIARCPAHNDSRPSLMLWEDQEDSHVGIKCYSGCSRRAICEAIGLQESDLYIQDGKKRAAPTGGISLYDLLAEKLIHPNILSALDITDGHRYKGKRAVHIPYYTIDGKPYARYRIRTALSAKEGSFWNAGNEPIIPFGISRFLAATTVQLALHRPIQRPPMFAEVQSYLQVSLPGPLVMPTG